MRTVNPSLLLLVLVWVALLLPGALRSQLRSSPRTTVGGFQRAMDGLRTDRGLARGTAPTQRLGGPPLEDPLLVRRRTRFLRLVAFAVLTLLVAPFVGGAMWLTVGVAWSTVLSATLVLRRLKLQRSAARRVLTQLDLRRPAQPIVDEITGELLLAAGSSSSSVRLRSWGD
jgi:hypothetical protein